MLILNKNSCNCEYQIAHKKYIYIFFINIIGVDTNGPY